MTNDFKTNEETEDAYYDLFEDWNLIESSFTQQYNIRLRKEDDMTWDEFTNLLSGLGGETPLGNVVRIRSEKDKDSIKHFTKSEKAIWKKWQERTFANYNMDTYEKQMDALAAQMKFMSLK